MHSCIYEGRVTHCRYEPVVHKFWYRLYMAYLDLDELRDSPTVRSLVPQRRLASAGFLPSDHLHGWEGSLRDSIRNLVEQQSGTRPTGPIRLLTQLRHFGYYFSPLNLFYCFNSVGTHVEAIVSEVNNTPWREQHHYVLSEKNRREGPAGRLHYAHAKDFHVSPFLQMDYQYDWQLTVPSKRLEVRLANRREGSRTFEAALLLEQRPLSRRQLSKMLVRYPVMTAEIMLAIYWQAFRLWWKKCPVYSHPAKHHRAGGMNS